MLFSVNEPLQVVRTNELTPNPVSVLGYVLSRIICHSDIQSAVPAIGHNVHPATGHEVQVSSLADGRLGGRP